MITKKLIISNSMRAIVAAFALTAGMYGASSTVAAASVKQVSTGSETACAVVDTKAQCWGANESGQLGNGTKVNSSSPVAVSVRAEAIAEVKECAFGIFCTIKVPYQPASALAGKAVQKVSVGTTHACALADAQVFCWGDNSHGQLGNRSTTSTTLPIAVDTSDSNASAKSALFQKEIIDISAGDSFTCALASDGTVACWGEGDNGRLGANSSADTNYPQSIYNSAGTAFAGKKGVKLAKAGGATMCVIAVSATASSATGDPYCWGYGIDDGTAIPASTSATTACSKTSSSSRPPTGDTTNTVIFQSLKPVSVPGVTLSSIDGNKYVSALATNGRAYYWGMYGYTETANYTNITSCVVNPCTASVKIGPTEKLVLALTSSQQKAKAANQGGGDKKRNLNSNNSAAASAYAAANGYTDKTQYSASQTAGWSYAGVATPSFGYYAASGKSTGGNNNGTSNSCVSQTRYGFTKNAIYAQTGQKVATVPPAWPQTQGPLNAISGNVYNGLFCATAAAAQCDTKGTSSLEGQTGSGYTPQCTTSGFIFTTTTCSPPPTGPQQVVTTGWLAGKAIKTLDTGLSGYTCAVANGSVGCWGINTKGQLGNGTTSNKNVPTAVNL